MSIRFGKYSALLALVALSGCLPTIRESAKSSLLSVQEVVQQSQTSDGQPIPSPSSSQNLPAGTAINAATLSLNAIPAALSDFVRVPESNSAVFTGFPGETRNIRDAKFMGQSLVVDTLRGLMVSNDRGATWVVRNTRNGLHSDSVMSSLQYGNRLFVGTLNGLSVSVDGGITFAPVASATFSAALPGPDSLAPNRSIALLRPTVAALHVHNGKLFVGYGQGMLVSTDGGATFTNRTRQQLPGLFGRVIRLATIGTKLLALTVQTQTFENGVVSTFGSGGFFVSSDDGVTWTRSVSLPAQTFLGRQPFLEVVGSTVVVHGQTRTLYVSRDEGATFAPIDLPVTLGNSTDSRVKAIGGKFFVFGSEGRVATTADFVTYTTVDVPTYAATIMDVSAVAHSAATGETFVFYPGLSRILSSADGWATISERPILPADRFPDSGLVNMYSAGNRILLASVDGAFHSADLGTTFTDAIRPSAPANPAAVIMDYNNIRNVAIAGNRLILATAGGLFYNDAFNPLQANALRTWVRKTTVDGLPSNDVVSANGVQNFVVAGTSAGLAISTNTGVTFTRSNLPATANSVSRYYLDGLLQLLATNGGVVRSVNGGQSYEVHNAVSGTGLPETRVNDIQKAGANFYAMTVNGFAVSTNSGASWTVPPVRMNGVLVPVQNLGPCWGAVQFGTRIYVGTTLGVAVSANNGASFQIVGATTGMGAVRDIKSNGTELFVVAGGLYRMVRESVLQ